MVIFDLDGTLWNSAVSVAQAWNIEVSRDGSMAPVITAEDINGVMGLTMDEIADIIFRNIPVPERYELARRCEVFENEYITEHGGDLYPGVEETLESLLDAGVQMSIVSNCQEGYVKAFLDSMNMHRYFVDYEEWGRSGLLKADNIRLVMKRNDAADAVYVGDIQNDANACIKAGVPCIWAAYGFGHIQEPAAVIRSFDELPEVLRKDFPRCLQHR